MKELSIEEKANRYDEAIKAAVIAHKDEDKHLKATLERIFPELAESEDEKIRKEIVDFLELPHPQFVGKRDHEKWIAWLEKQDNQPSITKEEIEIFKKQAYKEGRRDGIAEAREEMSKRYESSVPMSYGQDLDEALKEASRRYNLPNTNEEKYSLADVFFAGTRAEKAASIPKWTELTWQDINYLEQLINNVHYEFRNGIGEECFGKEVLEKFREHKGDEYLDSTECEQQNLGLENAARLFLAELSKTPYNISPIKQAQKITKELIDFLENTVQNNPDAIDDEAKKPKFKKDDWITDGVYTYCVDKVGDGYYDLVSSVGVKTDKITSHVDNNFVLWSIYDAKPGEIIYSPNGPDEYYIFVFDGIVNHAVLTLGSLYRYEDGGSAVEDINTPSPLSGDGDIYYPATKQQRAEFEESILQEGYEWSKEDNKFIEIRKSDVI